MKIYSSIITRADLLDALRNIEGVAVDNDGIREFTPRRGGRGFELYLEGYGERHYRARNGREGYAASWDDYGVWMDRLYRIDPDAKIAWYEDYTDFLTKTRAYAPNQKARAPWLLGKRVQHWPDAQQVEADRGRIERKRKREVREQARRLRSQADRLLSTL